MALDPLELSSCGFYERQSNSKDYPYQVLCKLCKRLVRSFKMKFIYSHVMDGDPDPEVLRDFCFKMIRENFAVVKVEMATKSITRTVKDQRYNLVSKVSSLGKSKECTLGAIRTLTRLLYEF